MLQLTLKNGGNIEVSSQYLLSGENNHLFVQIDCFLSLVKMYWPMRFWLLWAFWMLIFYPWANQISSWMGCVLFRFLWKGWMFNLPIGKKWTQSRSTTTANRWYWKFFAKWHLQWCLVLCSKKEWNLSDFHNLWKYALALPRQIMGKN